MTQTTRDYRHGYARKQNTFQRKSQQAEAASPTRTQSGGRPKWVLVSLGVSLVLLTAFFVVQHFAHHGVKSGHQVAEAKSHTDEQMETEVEEKAKPLVVESVAKAVAEPVEAKVDYTFYTELAETEVVVDVEPISVTLPVPYTILAGTFVEKSHALKELARLHSFGQTLEVSELHKNNRIYYRLKVGPFTDRLVLNKKRNELRRLGVDTLLIKEKAPSAPRESAQTG